jgi:RNA ligase
VARLLKPKPGLNKMNYIFPEIRTINDVLPHIEGREEFIVAEREGYTVINYVVAMTNTFDMTGPDDIGGAMRRECRGLIFDADGNLMSRPFHKFFNVNERAETQTHEIDMSQPHVIMEKMDGSMIRPILVDGYLRLATKMGVTNVAMDAEAWLAGQDPSMKEWLRFYIDNGYTPIFEWVSPFNQIVIAYEEADLVLLAIRNNVTGEYLDLVEELTEIRCPFNVVRSYGSMDGDILEYIDRQRGKEGREGDIIRFADGHMLKVKNDWYVRIHKTIDRITFDRNIVNLIINEEVDDVIPMLPAVQVDRIRDFEKRFWAAFKQKENRLLGQRMNASQTYDDDRKRIALEMVPNLEDKADAAFIFRMLDGSNIRDLLLDHVRKNIFSNTKWNDCAEWLGM